jgi:NhaA family Na+:H+ antiporter
VVGPSPLRLVAVIRLRPQGTAPVSHTHRSHTPLNPSKLEPLLQPVQAFLSAESAGGIALIIAALAALAWANSPWGQTYHAFWHTKLSVGTDRWSLALSLEHWVNDGLMVLFFVLVGLEIKRELLLGELASMRHAALPIAAAVGGMVAPAAIYAALNAGGPGAAGWGIPMATDIAFAVAVLALLGRAMPISVKVFLLAVAIVDDLGAVLVIAIFYTSNISVPALAVAGSFLFTLVLLNELRVHHPIPYVLLGIGLWAATLLSGVHATVAGVLLAFTIPATRQIEDRPYVEYARRMLDDFERDTAVEPDTITVDQSHAIKAMEEASQAVQTPLARMEHALLKPVTFVIVPVFALANAGVDVRSGGASGLSSPVTWGILLGLLLGKPLGVLLASWLALKSGITSLPTGATWRQMIGVSVLCGIGFTMSLFIGNLAFAGQDEALKATKVGILISSLLAGVVGGLIIAAAGKLPARIPGEVSESSVVPEINEAEDGT